MCVDRKKAMQRAIEKAREKAISMYPLGIKQDKFTREESRRLFREYVTPPIDKQDK